MATVLAKFKTLDEKIGTATTSTTSLSSIPPLGIPIDEKRFWWQRAKAYDPDATATLVRVLLYSHPDMPFAHSVLAECL